MTCIGLEINILPTFIFLAWYQRSKVGVSEQVHAPGLFGICGFSVQAAIVIPEWAGTGVTLNPELVMAGVQRFKECFKILFFGEKK